MTDNIMTLIDYLRKVGLQEDLDFCREAAQYFGQKIIDIEAEEVIGAQRYERAETHTNQRNGTRNRILETRVGELPLCQHLMMLTLRWGSLKLLQLVSPSIPLWWGLRMLMCPVGTQLVATTAIPSLRLGRGVPRLALSE